MLRLLSEIDGPIEPAPLLLKNFDSTRAWAAFEKPEGKVILTGEPAGAATDPPGLSSRIPSRAEIEHLLGRMEEAGRWHFYVPAFWTTNTRAYIRLGKLMTRSQPTFHAELFDDPDEPVMCVLGPADAERLAGYVFLATLPESLRSCARFVEGLRLETGAPVLIEFPFLEHAGSLESLVGGFHVQSQIVAGAAAEAD